MIEPETGEFLLHGVLPQARGQIDEVHAILKSATIYAYVFRA